MTNKQPVIRMFPNRQPVAPVVEEVKVEAPVAPVEVVAKPKKKAKE